METKTPDPAEMLEILTQQQRSIQAQLGGLVPPITLTWGLAWLIGFGALFTVDGLRPGFTLPIAAAITIFATCMAVAIGLSTWLGIRSSRGIKSTPANAFTGTVYGMTWTIGSIGLAGLGGALASHGMPPELANYYYPAAFILFAGVMYVIAGAIWQAMPSVITGGILVAVALIGAFLPHPFQFLFYALAGGGTFLVLSAVSLRWIRSSRSRLAGDAR